VTADTPSPSASRGLALAAASAVTFSAKAIFVKLAFAAAPVDAVTLLTLRMLWAAPGFVALSWWASRRAGQPWTRRRVFAVVGLGFLGYYLASLLDFLGLEYISAALERLVLFLYPTIVVLLSALLLRRPITRREGGALVLSYVGIAVVMAKDATAPADAAGLWIGCALVFASAVAYAVYLIGAQRLIASLGAVRFTAAAMLVSSSCAVVHFAATRPVTALLQPARVQVLAAAMAVVSTVIPTILLGAAIKRIGSGRTALVGSIGPVATIALGYAVLGEPITGPQLVGAALVLAGVVLVGGGTQPLSVAPATARNAGTDGPAAADTSATADPDRAHDSARSSSRARS